MSRSLRSFRPPAIELPKDGRRKPERVLQGIAQLGISEPSQLVGQLTLSGKSRQVQLARLGRAYLDLSAVV